MTSAEIACADEWDYVNGPAVPKRGCTPGFRDESNAGRTPYDFLREANDHINARRKQGYGTYMLEIDALLTLDEGPPHHRPPPLTCPPCPQPSHEVS